MTGSASRFGAAAPAPAPMGITCCTSIPSAPGRITDKIDHGDLSEKPGWVRLSVHPTTTDAEVQYLLAAVQAVADRHTEWGADYTYSPITNEFQHLSASTDHAPALVRSWFGLGAD